MTVPVAHSLIKNLINKKKDPKEHLIGLVLAIFSVSFPPGVGPGFSGLVIGNANRKRSRIKPITVIMGKMLQNHIGMIN